MLSFRNSGTPSATDPAVLYFFRRGDSRLSCETRLNPDGPGFQLVIVENGDSRIEDYAELPALLSREHQLLQAWRTQGWRDVGRRERTSTDPLSGRGDPNRFTGRSSARG